MPRHIVRGQPVNEVLKDRAKQMRLAMTPEERVLWQELRGSRLGLGMRFRRQQIVHGYIVDFYCHVADLVVEVDGPIHDDQFEHDTMRDQILASLGLRVLRFKNNEIRHNLDAVLTRIHAALHGLDDQPT
jgi:very-short-patch-repair endonuclease